jgi:hypothetical protein
MQSDGKEGKKSLVAELNLVPYLGGVSQGRCGRKAVGSPSPANLATPSGEDMTATCAPGNSALSRHRVLGWRDLPAFE